MEIWKTRTCPLCGAEPFKRCVSRSGKVSGIPHKPRWPEDPRVRGGQPTQSKRKADARARGYRPPRHPERDRPCPVCGVTVGSRCVKRDGSVAPISHVARRRGDRTAPRTSWKAVEWHEPSFEVLLVKVPWFPRVEKLKRKSKPAAIQPHVSKRIPHRRTVPQDRSGVVRDMDMRARLAQRERDVIEAYRITKSV